MFITPNKHFDRTEIRSHFAESGTGRVYLAHDSSARKCIPDEHRLAVTFDGSSSQPATSFNKPKSERFLNLGLSHNRKQLVLARGGLTVDDVLISKLK